MYCFSCTRQITKWTFINWLTSAWVTSFTLVHKIMDSNRAKISIMFADGIINHRTACKTYAGTHKSFREKLEKISTTYIILKKNIQPRKSVKHSQITWNNLQRNVNHYLISEPVRKTDRKRKRNFGISRNLVLTKNSTEVNEKSHK